MNSPNLYEKKETTNDTPFVERRHCERFRLRDGGIALMTPPGPHSTIVGQILDISTGGLSFRYISDVALGSKASEVTLVSAENKSYLRGLPVQAISDFEIAKMPFGIMSPRRYGLKFGKLSEQQVLHLRHFIVDHAADRHTAPDL